jgi:hypothetical protein
LYKYSVSESQVKLEIFLQYNFSIGYEGTVIEV